MTDVKRPFRLCIFLHSGSYDRFFQAIAITNTVLATGGEVNLFCSYGALKRLVKGNLDEVAIEGEAVSFRDDIEKNLKRGAMDKISEMLDLARRFGRVKIYACTASMAVLNITRDELAEVVDASMGLVGFLEIVKGSDRTLYI